MTCKKHQETPGGDHVPAYTLRALLAHEYGAGQTGSFQNSHDRYEHALSDLEHQLELLDATPLWYSDDSPTARSQMLGILAQYTRARLLALNPRWHGLPEAISWDLLKLLRAYAHGSGSLEFMLEGIIDYPTRKSLVQVGTAPNRQLNEERIQHETAMTQYEADEEGRRDMLSKLFSSPRYKEYEERQIRESFIRMCGPHSYLGDSTDPIGSSHCTFPYSNIPHMLGNWEDYEIESRLRALSAPTLKPVPPNESLAVYARLLRTT